MRPYTISETLQNAALATGTGTVMDISGMVVVGVQVTIAATATITFEASVGSGTMTALPATNLATGAVGTTATATGIYLCNVAGLSRFQARISSWGSGAVTAVALASSEASASIAGALGSGSTTLIGPLGQTTKSASLPVVPASDWGVQGDIAAAATDSGNPVKTGGKYNSTKPTYTNGQRGDTQIEVNGATAVSLYGKNSAAGDSALASVAAATGVSTGTDVLGAGMMFYDTTNVLMRRAVAPRADGVSQFEALAVGELVFNGTNLDRRRNTTANTVLASAARTSTVSTDVTNHNGRSFTVFLNITVAPNTASTLTIAIREKDSISSNYVSVLTGAAITGSVVTGSVPVTNRYVVALGVTVAANVSASDALARTMNVLVTHSNSDSWTYSISADIGV